MSKVDFLSNSPRLEFCKIISGVKMLFFASLCKSQQEYVKVRFAQNSIYRWEIWETLSSNLSLDIAQLRFKQTLKVEGNSSDAGQNLCSRRIYQTSIWGLKNIVVIFGNPTIIKVIFINNVWLKSAEVIGFLKNGYFWLLHSQMAI